jgi:small subunit ribosomal protein S3
VPHPDRRGREGILAGPLDGKGDKGNQEGEVLGQKVHPYGFRLGYTKTWKSRWFAKKDYSEFLHEDLYLKEKLTEQLKNAGVSDIQIERPGNKLRVTIHTARPGIIIGRKGSEIDRLRQELQKRTGREVLPINIAESTGRS